MGDVTNVELFIDQVNSDAFERLIEEGNADYFAGRVCKLGKSDAPEDNLFLVFDYQYGAAEFFRVGMPVYDEDLNLMGYLGLGLWKNLDVSHKHRDVVPNIPSTRWEVRNPTEHCKNGKRMYTFWQMVNKKRGALKKGAA